MTDNNLMRSNEMNRPYIICRMTTSIDGKVTGDFLSDPECRGAQLVTGKLLNGKLDMFELSEWANSF